MFENQESVSDRPCIREGLRCRWIRVLLRSCLLVLLISGPVHGTDPIDVDPDPDGMPVSVTLHVRDLDSIDWNSLPAGHYVIVVEVDGGPDEIHEIWVH